MRFFFSLFFHPFKYYCNGDILAHLSYPDSYSGFPTTPHPQENMLNYSDFFSSEISSSSTKLQRTSQQSKWIFKVYYYFYIFQSRLMFITKELCAANKLVSSLWKLVVMSSMRAYTILWVSESA